MNRYEQSLEPPARRLRFDACQIQSILAAQGHTVGECAAYDIANAIMRHVNRQTFVRWLDPRPYAALNPRLYSRLQDAAWLKRKKP